MLVFGAGHHEMLILQGPKQSVESLTFSPDSTRLYVVQGHHGIREWNLIDQAVSRVEFGGRLVISQFVFYPGGRWAFSATMHAAPTELAGGRVIDLAAGTMQPFDLFAYRQSSITFPTGAVNIVTVGNSYVDPDRWTQIMESTDRLYGWTMTPSGPQYAWHRDIPRNEPVLSLVALGDRLATAEQVYEPDDDEAESPGRPQVTIRRGSDGGPERTLHFPLRRVQQLLASPHGDLLVASCDTELCVWKATDWNALPVVVAGSEEPMPEDEDPWEHDVIRYAPRTESAVFHPSGRHLLWANGDSSVIAFDATAWKVVQRWTWNIGALRAVAVSPDGLLAAAGGAEGTVVVWDLDL